MHAHIIIYVSIHNEKVYYPKSSLYPSVALLSHTLHNAPARANAMRQCHKTRRDATATASTRGPAQTTYTQTISCKLAATTLSPKPPQLQNRKDQRTVYTVNTQKYRLCARSHSGIICVVCNRAVPTINTSFLVYFPSRHRPPPPNQLINNNTKNTKTFVDVWLFR